MMPPYRRALLAATVLALTGATPALASAGTPTEDLVPPQLVSVQVSPASVDAGAGEQVTFTAVATDDLSGVATVGVYARGSDGGALHALLHRVDGTATSGTWQGTATTLRHGTPAGTYTITEVFLQDAIGNRAFADDPAGDHLTVQVSNDARQDGSAPVAVSGRITPGTVDVTTSGATVTYRLHITDDQTGVAAAFLVVGGPTDAVVLPSVRVYLNRVSGTARDGVWTGQLRVPRYSAPGTWTVYGTNLYDAVGNEVNAGAGPFRNRLTVVDRTPDLKPPRLLSEQRSPRHIDTRSAAQQVRVTVRAADVPSGVRTVTASALGRPDRYGDPLVSLPGTLTRSGGSWTGVITVPRYSWQGTWQLAVQLTDRTGNVRIVSPTDLHAAGFPSTFVNVEPSLP